MLNKKYIIICFLFLRVLFYGQKKDTTVNYEYDVSFITGKQKGHILINKTISVSDTGFAFVKGQITDFTKEPVPFGYINFIDKTTGDKQKIQATYDGMYKMKLKQGAYQVQITYVGKPTYDIPELRLKKGEVRQLNICQGESEIMHSRIIKSKVKLSKGELLKKKHQLKREYLKQEKRKEVQQKEIKTDNAVFDRETFQHVH